MQLTAFSCEEFAWLEVWEADGPACWLFDLCYIKQIYMKAYKMSANADDLSKN